MRKLTLDPTRLRVQSFAVSALYPSSQAPASYPDCPTATGCTCIPACQSIVGGCTSVPITVASE